MANLPLTFACGLYDRMLPLFRGQVSPDGIDLRFIPMDGSAGARDIFDRMASSLEFDVAEMSCSEFVAQQARGDTRLVALPVFPSRVFRHGMITVNAKSGITAPKDLEGKRIGLPIYTMSAAIWARGHLQHDYGLDLSTVRWLEGAVNAPGGHGHPSIPPLFRKVEIERNTGAYSLSDLLERREIDAIIGTVLPKAFGKNPDIRRLFPDYREIEKALYAKKRIFPIMHVLAIRRDVHERHPFVASSLFDAMCASKDMALVRMRDVGTLQYMLPWMTADLDEIDEVFGGDPWPYGIEPNRPTLTAFLTYLDDQGVIENAPTVDELFVPVRGRYSGMTGLPSQTK